ncbi:toxin TcdB middle/N-terminal domain-containing protein [Variovorax sp. J22P240]|uniref:toxin TcdB middle/N-terminal domain-containing protein n=1 Tax=Variovorax sp. J22P240 TaxID=3053514 RepID=UPI00257691F0|nr:toxin TcdB middle/N-terminal domain-containing protein [Variovorax sp. J22P240]MDM0001833.1 toxin TcdB middle/N-terminal domain-containing protein [Variovorax sp. J22P240]
MTKSATAQTAVSPPSGSGNVAGMGEAFSLDLNSGQGNFSVPFEVPDGVAGLKPRVKLEYAHGQANGPFGLGWRLPLRQIDRRLDLGVPNGGSVETYLDSGAELRRGADGVYRALRETAFSFYEFDSGHWVVHERDGSRFVLGASANARVADPDHPERVQSWFLERQEDAHGNAVDYVYERHAGYPYLAEIRYARFVVRLAYEERPDVLRNGRAGFERLIARRCRSVALHLAGDDREVRRLTLTYTASPGTGVSLLSALQLAGFSNGLPAVVKNPLVLSYETFDAGAVQIRFIDSAAGHAPPRALNDPDTALLALGSLPLPGVVENHNGRLYYWPNDGRGSWASARPLTQTVPQASSFASDGIQFIDIDGNGTADMLVGVGQAPLQGYYPNDGGAGFGAFIAYPRAAPQRPPFESGRARLADLDGDGVIDAMLSTRRGLVSYRNRGREGWELPVASDHVADVDLADPLTFLADMTGDGLPDLVQVRSGQVSYRLNLGLGRFGEPVLMAGSPRLASRTGRAEQILLADIDGDGCSDIVRLLPDRLELYLNRSGQGFAAPVVVNVLPPALAGTVRTVDFFGNGSAGLLYNSLRQGRTTYVHVGWSRGAPAYGLREVDNGNGLVSEIHYSSAVEMALRDLDAGHPWPNALPFPLWVVERTLEVDRVRGRTTELHYRYHEGRYDTRQRRFQGFRVVEKKELGDESRASVLTRHTFLADQAQAPGHTRAHAHLDRLLARVEVFSEDGTPDAERPWRVEESEYGLSELEVLPDGEPRVFVYAERTRKRHIERGNDERVEERRFAYDSAGNLVREVARGYGIRGGAAVPEKQVDTRVEYAHDPARRVFKMARTVKRDAAGSLLLELRRHYDGIADAGLPLGELTLGRMVREEHLVLDLPSYSAHYGAMDAASLGHALQPDADGAPAVFAIDKRLTYTAQGNVASETTGTGRRTEKRYDADGLHVVEEIANSLSSPRVPDPVTGKPLELRSPGGAQVRMVYDAFGRLTHFMQADDTEVNATRTLAYDDTSVPNAVRTSYRIDAARRAVSVAYYDGTAQEVQRRVQRAPGDVQVSAWLVHNPWRQTQAEFEPTMTASLDFAVPDLSGPVRRTFFDGEGRPVASINYNGARCQGRYTPFEIHLADAHDLDPTHPQADTPRVEEVDVWNHRTMVTENTPAGPETLRYEVGLFGELLAIRDAFGGEIARYTYDCRGQRLSVDHRDTGRREQWFNSQGEIVRTRDAAGHEVEVDRDGEGRITEVRHNAAVVESFVYDDITPGADGRLIEARYANGRQRFAYSLRGFLVEHLIEVAGQPFTLRYERDDLGHQLALTYADGTRITRHHDDSGQVRRIDGIVDAVTYSARNLPTRIDFANGVHTEIVYAPGVGHVERQRTVGPGGMVLEDATYGYDAMMQLLSLDDAAPSQTRQLHYEYDALQQLTRVSGTDPGGTFDHLYSYLGRGRLSSHGESGWLLRYNDPIRPDRLSTINLANGAAAAINYDANGNIVQMPGRHCEFDFKNHLTRVTLDDGTVIDYDYDYRGNRVRRRVTRQGSTTESIHLGRMTEIRGGLHTNFAIFDRRRVALRQGAATRWIHVDPLGSANLFSDEAGTRIVQTAYLPFGTERRHVAAAPLLRIFALHDVDDETGLIYMGHRWYSPQAGRFLTPDALYLLQPEKSDGDPAPLHLYAYAGNNPINHVDPEGLSFWSVVGAIVGVIVGVVIAVAVVAAFATGIGFGILAVIGVIGLVTVSYVVAHSNQGSALGEFFRGFMIGLNAGMNAAFLTMMGFGVVGLFVGVVVFMASIDSVANNEVYQGILGWSNWLMPMSWLVLGLGAAMWVLNGLGHLIFWTIPNLWGGGIQFFRITGFRMDWSTGMLATRGGWVSNLNTIDTAYNMGAFAYVDSSSTGWHLDHEAGHNLSLGAFGSIFHFVGFIHEMATPAGSSALSEQIAEGNDPSGTGPSVPMWS